MYEKFLKRIFDCIIASMILIILAPVYLTIWILIKLDSKGSGFYKQERVGRNRKTILHI